jgi:Zn-dependent protease with chaperone function
VAAALAGMLTFLANLAFFIPLGSTDDDAPNPLSGHGLSALFRTHPPTPARIRRLQQMSRHPSR